MNKLLAGIGLSAATLLMLAACASGGDQTQPDTSAPDTSSGDTNLGPDPDEALAALASQVLSLGPNGESPQGFETTELTDAEVEQIQAAGLSAAIVLHYGGNDWSAAQVEGLTSEFNRLGINIVAVTDANFRPEQQVSDIETVLALNPDIIVSIPTDPVATADAYAKARDAGVQLVFMDNVPAGFTGGVDYVSVVSADNKGNGVASAHLMAKALGGEGTIALIYHDADFFVTKQRYEGFKETIQLYPRNRNC